MPRIYLSHVREGLAELASEELQRQLWLSPEHPSSFVEAVARTYDDSGLGDVLDEPLAVEEIGPTAVGLLQELSRALASVYWTVDEAALISSPEMLKIRPLAAAALNALPS